MRDLITTAQALRMSGGILPLVQVQPTGIFNITWASHLVSSVVALALGYQYQDDTEFESRMLRDFAAVGQFLLDQPELPWVSGRAQPWSEYLGWHDQEGNLDPPPRLDEIEYLGAAAILLIATEAMEEKSLPVGGPDRFGPLSKMAYYILRRWGEWDDALPDLPVQPQYAVILKEWADNKVSFRQPTDEPS